MYQSPVGKKRLKLVITGKCNCKPNIVGHDCEKCKDGYWNLMSGDGCEACNCDPIGIQLFNYYVEQLSGFVGSQAN